MAEAEADAEDDWEAPPRAPSIPELHLDGFDGPMDLLLDLAERQRDRPRPDVGARSGRAVRDRDGAAGRAGDDRAPGRLAGSGDAAGAAALAVAVPRQPSSKPSPQSRMRLRTSSFCRSGFGCGRRRRGLRRGRSSDWTLFTRPLPPKQGRSETRMALLEACLVVLRGPNNRPEAAPVYRPLVVRLWRVEQAAGADPAAAGGGSEGRRACALPAGGGAGGGPAAAGAGSGGRDVRGMP